jgi:PAS domain S-box-containing protein
MRDDDKTREQLIDDLAELRQRVATLEANQRQSRTIIDSTQQKRAEEALRQSEGRYRALAESTRDIIYILDPQGTLLYANQAALQCIGIGSGEIVGKRQADLFPPEMARAHVEKIGLVCATGEVLEEDELFHFGPEEVWLRIHLLPLRDEAGQITAVMGVCHNITDRKRAEEALREREARLVEAQEVARLGFYVLDIPQGHWTSSPILDQIFDIPPGYLRTVDGWGDLIHPGDRPGMLDYFSREVAGEGKPFDREYRIVRWGDKQVRWVHGLGRLQFNAEGRPVSMLGTIQDITDRKRGEDELAKSKAVLNAAIECLPFDFFAMGEDGRYMLANAVCRADWGPVVGRTPEELATTEEMRALWADNNRRALAGEKVEDMVTVTVNGKERIVYQVITPIRDEMRSYGILGVNIDVTERKRAEEALQKAHHLLEEKVRERTAELSQANLQLKREIEERRRVEEALRQSERRFRNYFEQGLIGMAVTSLDKRWLEVNDRLCEILGYSREELVQTDWPALTHPEDVGPNLRLFNPLLAGEIEHFTLNKRYLKKDGSIVHATIHTRAFRKDDGTIDHIVTLIEDITARKQAEEALRISEEQYRGVAEACPDAIVMSDLSGRVLFASRQTWGLLGLADSDQLAGRSVFEYVIENDRKRLAENMSGLMEAGVRRNTEYTSLRKDGTTVPAEASSTVIRDAEGRPKAVMAVIRDITERKRAEEALERERQTLWHMLQASDYERRLIAYDIHDGLAQYLAAAGMQFQTHEALNQSSPSQARKAYETAVELVRQAHSESRRLINEVRPPVIDEIGLETAISHLVHEQRRHGGPEIECHSGVQFGRLPSILENALYRIVQEALTNACKHGKSKKVTVAMTQEGQDVRVEVRDWGVGFNPGSVGKGHFGLEGIRQRVRLLGGRLTIDSTPGSGTRIQVVVPIVETPNEE